MEEKWWEVKILRWHQRAGRASWKIWNEKKFKRLVGTKAKGSRRKTGTKAVRWASETQKMFSLM